MASPRRTPSGSSESAEKPRGPSQSSKLYDLVVTPINFISFIISLILVDMRFTIMRSHSHSEARSRLPPWLYRLLYIGQPYQYLDGNGHSQSGPWYYHTKQKKLMRMEANEAFRMRNSVLVLLTVMAVTLVGLTGYLANRLYGRLYSLLVA